MITSSTTVILVVGRIVLSVFFLLSGVTKIARNKMMVEYGRSRKLPMPGAAIALAALIELAGGLSVLTSFYPRIAAVILVVYLIPTTLIFHNFWTAAGAEKQNQGVHFMKNVAIVGGLLILSSIA
jgi:putative oxidoreductase